MDNLNWNGHLDHSLEPDRACRERSIKADIMNEALPSSLDLQRLIWPHEMHTNYKEIEKYYFQQQEENLPSDQLLPLPLTTSNSEDLRLIRNIQTFSSNCCNASSVQSDNHPFSCSNQRIDSNIKSVIRRCEDSCNPLKSKKAKLDCPEHESIDFGLESGEELHSEVIAQVKEMVYRAAALRPVGLGAEELVEKPRRKNLRISNDPQTTAARLRRERISEKLRELQGLVPGGRKMDTASMLDEAANYLKFLKSQVTALEKSSHGIGDMKSAGLNCCSGMLPLPVSLSHYSSPKQTCIFYFPRY